MTAKYLFAAVASLALIFGTSCSTMDLGGSVPVPFTEPATDAVLDLNFRPLPPRFTIGLDLLPGMEPGIDE